MVFISSAIHNWIKRIYKSEYICVSLKLAVLRSVANFGLSTLLVAVLLWGGCISCSQYFAFTASHKCCDPVGHCRKDPVKTTCSIQPMDVPSTVHVIAPDSAVAAV